jgi:hypothetical protein
MLAFLRKLLSTRSPAPRRPGRRLVLESLENRIAPSVTYHGGPVLAHVQTVNVFYGQNWPSYDPTGSTRMALDRFQSDISSSAYMAMLGEYGVGRGYFAGAGTVADTTAPDGRNAASNTVQEWQIQQMLRAQILQGQLPRDTGQQLYFVYLPPHVHSTTDRGYLGHHDSFLLHEPQFEGHDIPVYYAVIPNRLGNKQIHGLNPFQQYTKVSSHELAEAVTNPVAGEENVVGLSGGWYQDGTFKEVADLANHIVPFTTHDHTYSVVTVFSNAFGRGVVPVSNADPWLTQTLSSGGVWRTTWTKRFHGPGGPVEILHQAIDRHGDVWSNFEFAPHTYAGWFRTLGKHEDSVP